MATGRPEMVVIASALPNSVLQLLATRSVTFTLVVLGSMARSSALDEKTREDVVQGLQYQLVSASIKICAAATAEGFTNVSLTRVESERERTSSLSGLI
jgi:hypothetical protein